MKFVAAALVSLCASVSVTAAVKIPDCAKYQHATALPTGFQEDGRVMLKPINGVKVAPEVVYYTNSVCVCATRPGQPYGDAFSGTPTDATLSCETAELYRRQLKNLGLK